MAAVSRTTSPQINRTTSSCGSLDFYPLYLHPPPPFLWGVFVTFPNTFTQSAFLITGIITSVAAPEEDWHRCRCTVQPIISFSKWAPLCSRAILTRSAPPFEEQLALSLYCLQKKSPQVQAFYKQLLTVTFPFITLEVLFKIQLKHQLLFLSFC